MYSKTTVAAAAMAVLASAGLVQGVSVEKRYTTINNVQHTFYGCELYFGPFTTHLIANNA